MPPSGELTTLGRVMVDGAPGVSGQTFFPGSTCVVTAASRSILTLSNLSRLKLSAETTLKLDFTDDKVTGMIEGGQLAVFVPSGVAARFMTTDATVVSDSRQPATFSVEIGRGGETTVSVEAGQVEMNVGNRTQLVSAGQILSTPGGSQPLPTPRQQFSKGKKIAAGIGIALLGAVIAIMLTGSPDRIDRTDFGGCVISLSPTNEPLTCRPQL
ncbi:MAG TPA: hypothetical protein VE842_11535 [Pyrinomonadaceae bacterium]|nr:hypothetical protein [Pyrinomonadaceae bacterium]